MEIPGWEPYPMKAAPLPSEATRNLGVLDMAADKAENKVLLIKVVNGYLVRSTFDRFDGVDFASDMRVFETFDALVSWLRLNFEGGAPTR